MPLCKNYEVGVKRLAPGCAQAATIRKCGQVYVPYRVLGRKYIGKFADIFYEEQDKEIRVVIITADDIEGRHITYEAAGAAIYIGPLYRTINWGYQAASYKVPVDVKEDSLEFILKKDLHQGL